MNLRKISGIILIIIWISLLSNSALAADGAYQIEELDMKITVPVDWITFTRNIDANDPNLSKLNTDRLTFIDFLKEQHIYLNSVCMEQYAEIVVVCAVTNHNQVDFIDLSDSDLEKLAEDFLNSDTELPNEARYLNYSLYENPNAKFIVFNIEQQMNGVVTNTRQYYTANNGNYISITMHSYKGEISDDLAGIHKNIVDSVEFENKFSILNLSTIEAGLIGAGIGVISWITSVIRKKSNQNKYEYEEIPRI